MIMVTITAANREELGRMLDYVDRSVNTEPGRELFDTEELVSISVSHYPPMPTGWGLGPSAFGEEVKE